MTRSLASISACIVVCASSVHAQQSRDSAGMSIVRNPAVARAPRTIVLPARPAVSIGVAEGAEADQLFRVRGATRLGDGRIVIANAGSLELRIYDPTGRHLKSVGQRGEGPGEFESMAAFARGPGDSLFVFDDRLRRVSVFTPEGDHARDFRLEAGEVARFPVLRGVLSDGTVIATAGRAYSPGTSVTGATRDTMLVLRFSRTGALESVLDRLPGSESYVLAREGSVSVSDLLFGRSSHAAVHGTQVHVGNNDDYRIDALDARGRRVRSVRSEQRVAAVTDADVRTERERRLPAMRGANNPLSERMMRDQRTILDAMPVPRTFPAWRTLTAGDDGRLWVESWTRPSEPAEWAAFDARGALSLVVRGPAGAKLSAAGADWLLLYWRDEDDVEHVGLWPLS